MKTVCFGRTDTIVPIDVDTQKTFFPLCPAELPVIEGNLIVEGLDAQAKLADLRVMTKDAHSPSAKWSVENSADMLKPTRLNDADLTWVPYAIVGTYGYELLDGLPQIKEYDYCVWKGVDPELHPYGACFHDIEEKLSTGLLEWLKCKGADTVIVGGLTTGYYVKTTVLQLLKGGKWKVIVNAAACRGIAPDIANAAWKEVFNTGAVILENTEEIYNYINNR